MEQTEAMKELKSLLSYKSYSGLLYYASMLGILLAVIGLVCPFCSYNPTILEETKHTLQSWNLSLPIIAIVIITLASSFIITTLCIRATDWRKQIKRFIFCPIAVIVLVMIAYAAAVVACVFYEIPEEKFYYLETEMEAGFYLYTIGSFLYALAFSGFCYLMLWVAKNKTTSQCLSYLKKKQI